MKSLLAFLLLILVFVVIPVAGIYLATNYTNLAILIGAPIVIKLWIKEIAND